MKVHELMEILKRANPEANIAVGVWLEECTDIPAMADIENVEHVFYPEGSNIPELIRINTQA